METTLHRFEPLWGVWQVEKLLGQGSFGRVWQVVHETPEGVCRSAVKEITIPFSTRDLQTAIVEGLDVEGAKVYFTALLDETKKEIALMRELAYCENVVHFEDHQIIKLDRPGEFGWVVLIRMERLIPFKDRLLEGVLTIQDVVRLGIHICRALESCARQGIVHRDIKPDNLFYNADTDIYKLGDFGIAHHLARPTEGKGRAGTLSYMSPEVYQGAQFTEAADLYALGMILYRLLNRNRPPLLPPYPIPYTPMERDRSLLERLRGTEPKAPAMAEEIENGEESCASIGVQIDCASKEKAVALGKIAQRQISADPQNRYPCPAALRAALEEISVKFP